MRLVADFHIHSKYSRATSRDMDLEHLYIWAKRKGVNILGTGDFTHPKWLQELKEKLEPAEEGLFKFKNQAENKDFFFRFIITGEISVVYSEGGKVRKIHHVVFVPSFEVAEKINAQLSWSGNLASDGRPTLGMSSYQLLKIILDTSKEAFLVPAHVWTPWFGIFGSKSGFDSIEECFKDLSDEIFAIETGLSSDPPMNWRLSKLDRITLVSNSDAHSPRKIAREANVFDVDEKDLSFSEIKRIIKEGDKKKFLYTIEFYPQEGKYYYDGHRNCNVSLSPEESKKYGGICPVCGKPLTLGVLHRVEELADRKKDQIPQGRIPYKSLVPLEEIIMEALNQKGLTKLVLNEYDKLISRFGSELHVLLDVDEKSLYSATLPKIAEGITRVREGKVFLKPGYDGEYGVVSVWSNEEKKTPPLQQGLFQ